ncbi:MAG TPA: hypothetical protein VNO79_10960 [Actinomycetota bacterium]|nr:hypothetical protein [Actinomycetota bacterium]
MADGSYTARVRRGCTELERRGLGSIEEAVRVARRMAQAEAADELTWVAWEVVGPDLRVRRRGRVGPWGDA